MQINENHLFSGEERYDKQQMGVEGMIIITTKVTMVIITAIIIVDCPEFYHAYRYAN